MDQVLISVTLDQVLDRLGDDILRANTGEIARRRSNRTPIHPFFNELKKSWGEFRAALGRFVRFAQHCRVIVGKTKVQRSYSGGTLCYKNRWVQPTVWLVEGDDKVLVLSPKELASVEEREDLHAKMMVYTIWPHLADQFFGVRPNTVFENIVDTRKDEIAEACVRACGQNWQNVVSQVKEIWRQTEVNLPQIVGEHLRRVGSRERKVFQKKLSDCLAETQGLVDVSPEALLALFKIGSDEIEIFRRFARRNRADIAIVVLDDMIQGQNLAKVKKIMES